MVIGIQGMRGTPITAFMQAKAQSVQLAQPTMKAAQSIPTDTTQALPLLRRSKGTLLIDQSKAWDALARGGHLTIMSRIYAQGRPAALEAVAKIAKDGDRLAAIHIPVDPIPEFAEQAYAPLPPVQIAGSASPNNVDIRYHLDFYI